MVALLTTLEKRRLEAFFGPQGAIIVESHLDELEKTFGSSAVIIKSVIDGKIQVHVEDIRPPPSYHIQIGKPKLRSDP
jgi:hypothetical protein